MNTNFAYDKMDYYSILEYLKQQATYLSENAWTDFSDADIGTIILKLMAMNSDMVNYQVEKGISELYLDTVIERVNAIALCKLIGYEPSHYQSAMVDLTYSYTGSSTTAYLPAYTQVASGIDSLSFYNIEKVNIKQGTGTFKAYEGTHISFTFMLDDVDENGRIYLDDYEVGTNTISIRQAGNIFTQVDNALYGEGELCYSVHIDLSNKMYIQLPTYYKTILSDKVEIYVDYLKSSGISGRIGANVIAGTVSISNSDTIVVLNENASEGGYDPETVEEIRLEAPAYAKTMNTLVTLNDFRILAKDFDGISDVVALDYNYEESGLIQPTEGSVNDAYKVNVYVLPTDSDSIYKEVDDPYASYTLLTKDKLTITNPSEYEYHFDLDTSTMCFSNENHTDSTTAYTKVKMPGTYKGIRIKYETDTEAGFDTLYILDGTTVLASVSGVNEGYIDLDGSTLTDKEITLQYIKDEQGSSGTDTVKVYIYGRTEDVVPVYTDEYTDVMKLYVADTKKKKPAGIELNYYDVEYIRPHIAIKVYMDQDDLRYDTASATIAAYLEDLYSRKNTKIGDPFFNSHLAKDIINYFDYINYLEVISVEYSSDGAIRPNNKQYVEVLASNMTVKVVPYEED